MPSPETYRSSVAVRRLNSIVEEDLPFVTITGETYVDVTPRETLEAAVAAVDYETARARQARAREAGRLVGTRIVHRDGMKRPMALNFTRRPVFPVQVMR